MKLTSKIAIAAIALVRGHVAIAQQNATEKPMENIIEAPQGMELVWNDEFNIKASSIPQSGRPNFG